MKTSALIVLGLALFGLSNLAHAAGDAAAGKQKSATCTACHGVDGNSTDPQYPRLAGQHASYLKRALLDYQSGARKNPIMAAFAAPLSGADIADLTAYFSSQTGLVTPVLPRLVPR